MNIKNPFMKGYADLILKHRIIHDENHLINKIDSYAVRLIFWSIVITVLSVIVFAFIDETSLVYSYRWTALSIVAFSFLLTGINDHLGNRKIKSAHREIQSELGSDGRLELAKAIKGFYEREDFITALNSSGDYGSKINDKLVEHAKNLIGSDSARHIDAIEYLFSYEYGSLSKDLEALSSKIIKNSEETELDAKLASL